MYIYSPVLRVGWYPEQKKFQLHHQIFQTYELQQNYIHNYWEIELEVFETDLKWFEISFLTSNVNVAQWKHFETYNACKSVLNNIWKRMFIIVIAILTDVCI